MRHTRLWTIGCALLVVLTAMVGPVQAEPSGQDVTQVAKRLAEMQMEELLAEWIKEHPELKQSSDMTWIRAMQLYQRAQGTTKWDRKAALLDQAIELMQQVVDKSNEKFPDLDPKSPDYAKEVMKNWEYRLVLFRVRGQDRIQPQVARAWLLHASPEDYATIRKHTKGLDDAIYNFERDISDVYRDIGRLGLRRILIEQKLNPRREQAQYHSSFVRLNAALGLDPEDEKQRVARDRILGDVLAQQHPFVQQGDKKTRHRALIASGRASRMRKQYEMAETYLQEASKETAVPSARMDALFELPRLYVDWGKFDKAESVIKQNIDSMKKATGSDKDDDLVAVYLKEALLGNYFWQKRATGEASADKRKEYQKKADLALMAFADRYAEKPEIISAFMNIVAQKYGEVENVEDAPLLVLVAAANRANSEGKFPKAERFLKEALGRTDDDLAAQLMPMALWEMAMLKNKMGKNVEAADAFLKIAIEYPKSGRAPQAAKFATISYNKLINLRAQEGVVAQNLREKFIEALTIYTDGWGGKPEVDKWYYDLGWQYRHLAEASSGPEREERVQASIAAFEKVPSELPEAIESRFRALEMRYERLQLVSNDTDAKEEEIRSEARTLAEGFRKYARDARERARTDANEARGKSIFNWGARAEFNAAVIRHRFLNDRAARTILAGLEERWPGTDVLEASAEKAIRWDLDQGRIDQAVKKYREFTQQYSKDKTRALTRLIGKTMAADIAELKARIQRTSSVEVREAAEKELAARQKQWPQLAKQAYQDAKADVEARDLPDEAIYAEHYDVVVMQGNALLEADRPNEALEIFQGLKKYQDQLKAQYQAEVDEFFETEKKRLDRGSSDRRFVLGRFADLNKYLMERGFDPEDISYTEEVAAAIERLDSPEVKTVDDRQKALAEVVERLKKAYDRLQVEVRKSYPVDPNTIRGLALAYSSMEGEEALQKAADYHRRRLRLVERANLQDYPPEDRAAVVRLFWEAQLDYAQFALKANKDRPGQLRLLIRRINQLQETDPQMGGLLAQFKAAERKAKDLARV